MSHSSGRAQMLGKGRQTVGGACNGCATGGPRTGVGPLMCTRRHWARYALAPRSAVS